MISEMLSPKFRHVSASLHVDMATDGDLGDPDDGNLHHADRVAPEHGKESLVL
jgi:hypothetical protein